MLLEVPMKIKIREKDSSVRILDVPALPNPMIPVKRTR